MKIPFATFKPMHDEIRKDLDQAYNKVIDSNYFIQGKECELFEKEFADYCNAKYCVLRRRYGQLYRRREHRR